MSSVYTIGGTVDGSTHAYVERAADTELLNHCRACEFAYLLTSRQMGKSSMMVHTIHSLHREAVQAVSISLETIGTQGVTPEQWYLGLMEEIGDQLGLNTAAYDYWEAHEHLSQVQRFSEYLEKVVLAESQGQLVIFIDEIDTTLSLAFSTDDFFATIRRLYNLRAERPELRQLSFVLIGVATPDDLIADPNRTPFNIGKRVELTDFSPEEAAPLKAGLCVEEKDQVMLRVFHWTDGHPYLTQRLCADLAEDQGGKRAGETTEAWVDRTAQALFFSERAAQDSNLDFIKNMLTLRIPKGVRPADILLTYQHILQAHTPEPDEERSPLKNHLKLSGVVKRKGPGLVVRNSIYRATFDNDWVKQRLPTTALVRQIWRRLTTTLAPVAVVASLLFAMLALFAFYQARQASSARAEAENARQLANEARMAAHINYLSTSGLLAAYSPSPYSGDQRRAALLVRQARNLAHTQKLRDEKTVQLDTLSNLLRANQVIGHLQATWQGHSGSVSSVAFSPDGRRVFSGSGDNSLRLWDLATGKPLGQPWQGHSDLVYSVAFSPDGRRVVSGSRDNNLRLWDAASGKPLGEPWQGHSDWVFSVAFSPDGRRVVSGSIDNSLRLWDAATGKPLGEPWQGHSSTVISVAFSPDGRRVVSGSRDNSLRLWDAATGQPLGEPWQGHSDWVNSVAFSPDGRRVVSGSADNSLRLWDAATGQPLGEPWQGHSSSVSSVAFSPDGRWVVSGSADNSLRLWDTASGQPLGEPWQGHNSSVSSVAFSPDGRWVVSGSGDNPNDQWDYMLLVWEMDDASWKTRGCAIAGRNLTLVEWRRYLAGRRYEKTCPEHPAHSSVIENELNLAASGWDAGQGQQHLAQAMTWIEEIPVRHDRIALLLSNFKHLPAEHTMRPIVETTIQQWIDRLPQPNRDYWQAQVKQTAPDR